ncbi:MAG: LysM peptidoglycan-binding domain-containing protein [Sedimentisphaerales bacterium]|nr:LysM peptidoglycan-binding domain-containing protein [Sedimentisphaerales bacterium]
MAKDAKIGSLIGLALIFIIAFVINGFTRSGRTANKSGPSSARADNTLNVEATEPVVGGMSILPTPNENEVEDRPTPMDNGVIDANSFLPPTEPNVPEPITNENTETPQPDTQRPSLSNVIYTVCEGDNLADIAKKFYGPKEGNRKANVLRIFLANRNVLTSPHDLRIGQKLVIPPLKTEGSDGELFSSSMFETVTSIGRNSLSTHEPTGERRYVVKEGDSLWSISAELLGDGSRYKEISKLNSGILNNDDELAVGMRLRIPAQ